MDLFLLVFAAVAVSAMLGGAIITFLFAGLTLLIITGMVGIGLMSLSVLAAVYNRSVTSFFKTLFCLAFALCTALTAYIICFIALNGFHLQVPRMPLYVISLFGGAIAGGFLGFAAYGLLQQTLRYLLAQLKTRLR